MRTSIGFRSHDRVQMKEKYRSKNYSKQILSYDIGDTGISIHDK